MVFILINHSRLWTYPIPLPNPSFLTTITLCGELGWKRGSNYMPIHVQTLPPSLKRCLQNLNVEHDVYQDQKPSNILTGKLEKIGVVSSAYYSPLHSDSSQKHFLNIRMSDISLFCSEALFLHSGSTGTQILSRKVRVSQPLPINSPPLSCRTIAELFWDVNPHKLAPAIQCLIWFFCGCWVACRCVSLVLPPTYLYYLHLLFHLNWLESLRSMVWAWQLNLLFRIQEQLQEQFLNTV